MKGVSKRLSQKDEWQRWRGGGRDPGSMWQRVGDEWHELGGGPRGACRTLFPVYSRGTVTVRSALPVSMEGWVAG